MDKEQLILRSAAAKYKASIKTQIKKRLPDWLIVIRRHCISLGKFPNLINPVTFNDKVLHRILFDRRALLTEMADKAAVRCYVESRLGSHILPKRYHITIDPETIPFAELPDRFVVKPTHASGWVHLVTDKSTLDRVALIATCKSWLSQSYYQQTREWPYKNIEPRIVVEEFIDDGTGAAPNDYKLFVFDGTVALIQVDMGRFIDHRRRLYTPIWEKVDALFGNDDIIGDVPRPPHLAEIVAAAQSLGKGIDFIRADFYDTAKQFYFGELTTTPACGLLRPREFDHYLGRRWKIRTH